MDVHRLERDADPQLPTTMPSKLQKVGPLWVAVPTVTRTPRAEISAAKKIWGQCSSRSP
jgi:hypothetical protein